MKDSSLYISQNHRNQNVERLSNFLKNMNSRKTRTLSAALFPCLSYPQHGGRSIFSELDNEWVNE